MHLAFGLARSSMREVAMNDHPTTDAMSVRPEAPARVGTDQPSGVIRFLRQQLGMTQEELAQALGITVGTVSRWEKGRFRPSRLARALIVEYARAHNIPLTLRASPRHA
jgi:DNA-binding transcriptional regulator YiaG